MDPTQLSGNINYENDIQPMPTQYETAMAIRTTMSFAVFKEPRGVMRILQFIFAICAFATTSGFSNAVHLNVNDCYDRNVLLEFDYPFRLEYVTRTVNCTNGLTVFHLIGNFSSDAQFFVTTGVLSFIYCIAISLFYVMCDNLYQSNGKFPLADFGLTVTLAVFWLSGSAAWASGLSNLKFATSSDVILNMKKCKEIHCNSSVVGSYSELDISVILGFLNFILWASDLWFLYKETPWFKVKQSTDNMGAKA